MISFMRLQDSEQIPHQLTRSKEGDAGLDISSNVDVIIPPGRSAIITTGVALAIPFGYYGRVSSRSGLKARENVESFHGTVDAGYRGELKVILDNNGTKSFKVSKGDKVSQLVIQPCDTEPANEVTTLPTSERGTDGFGSSGINPLNDGRRIGGVVI